MISVLPGNETVRTGEGEPFFLAASGTGSPYLTEAILPNYEYRIPVGIVLEQNAATAIRRDEDESLVGGVGLRFRSRREPGMVLFEVVGSGFQENVVALTVEPRVQEIEFSFPLWEAATLEILDSEKLLGSSNRGGFEEGIDEMLLDALNALRQVKAVALEEDCDEPSDVSINNAEVVLRQMFKLSPRIYDIYSMGSGEVVIDAGYGEHRVGVFCYPDGRMQYVGLVGDEPDEVRREGVETIPVDFLERVLSQLD